MKESYYFLVYHSLYIASRSARLQFCYDSITDWLQERKLQIKTPQSDDCSTWDAPDWT